METLLLVPSVPGSGASAYRHFGEVLLGKSERPRRAPGRPKCPDLPDQAGLTRPSGVTTLLLTYASALTRRSGLPIPKGTHDSQSKSPDRRCQRPDQGGAALRRSLAPHRPVELARAAGLDRRRRERSGGGRPVGRRRRPQQDAVAARRAAKSPDAGR